MTKPDYYGMVGADAHIGTRVNSGDVTWGRRNVVTETRLVGSGKVVAAGIAISNTCANMGTIRAPIGSCI